MSGDQADLSVLARNASQSAERGGDAPRVPLPRRHWKTRVLLPGAILAATGGLFLYVAGAAVWPALEVRVVPAVAKAGAASRGAVTVQAPGWIEADPFASAVCALADGVVREMLVLEGEPVQAGQVVARLVDDDARLALARAEAVLAERQAALTIAQAALAAAQSEWDHPIEATRRLAAAEALLAERRAELRQWVAELAAEEARLVELDAEFKRIAPLHQAGQATEIELIRARQQFEAQQAKTAATRAREEVLKAQIVRMEAEALAARDSLRLRISEARSLAEARGAVAREEAAARAATVARDEARLRLERMEVRAPVGGVVLARLVEPGAKLTLTADNPRAAQVVRLYDPRRLQVRVDVPLGEAAAVSVDQEAEITVGVLPDRVFHGRVTRIVHEADIQKNTLQVKVAVADPSPELKPEMLARARFLTVAADDAASPGQRLFIPQRLLQRGADGQPRVWLADAARGIARARAVTPGRGQVEGWIEIEAGLLPGDRLIADPPADLRDGRRIRVVAEED